MVKSDLVSVCVTCADEGGWLGEFSRGRRLRGYVTVTVERDIARQGGSSCGVVAGREDAVLVLFAGCRVEGGFGGGEV